jgi:hypothetical protein
MRARNIKPGFFVNEDLIAMPPLTRILFAGLWCMADREGRLEDRPKRIKMLVLPGDECDVDEMLAALADKGFILRYSVNNRSYIAVTAWNKHQRPHHTEKKSEIPAPNREITVNSPCRNGENPPDSLIPDSLIPDSRDTGSTSEPAVPVVPFKAPTLTAADNPPAKADPSLRFDEFWERWPNRVNKTAAAMAWASVVTRQNEAAVFACLGRWEASAEWSRGFYRESADRWLFRCARDGWTDAPAGPPAPREPPGKRTETRDETVQRLMAVVNRQERQRRVG